jgi:ferredoxin--NADP+ reductase
MEKNIGGARVAIIGAGPAGLFAARELAQNGIEVVLFNRDIKPGGLAEYGIYPDKDRIKEGLRTQFREIMNLPLVHYYGNIPIGDTQPLTIKRLKELGFDAVLVAAGAQGTKWLGLPGEDCQGSFHAKELVLHYNQLPPYASWNFPIGKKVAIIGVGNVMTDVVRYLVTQPQVEEIITIARRGLAEIKFDRRELEHIINHLDWQDFQSEVKRISPAMSAVGQVPEDCAKLVTEVYETSSKAFVQPKWKLHFLYSPVKILCQENRVRGVVFENNFLEGTAESTKAKGTGETLEVELDTIIFAIGDCVDPTLGLPVKGSGYAISQAPQFPVSEISFEVSRGDNHSPDLEGVFVCGWSRNASTGLVGIARRDGMNAGRAVLAYLKTLPVERSVELSALESILRSLGYNPITPCDLQVLDEVEKEHARQKGVSAFKFDTNDEMLAVMNKIE